MSKDPSPEALRAVGLGGMVEGEEPAPAEQSPEASGEKTEETKEEKSPEVSRAEDAGTLKRHNAELRRQLNQVGPWAQFGLAIGQDKAKGEKVLKRWQAGEQLFVDDEGQISDTPSEAGEKPLTRSELEGFMTAREGAKRQMDTLTELAEDSLPEFKKISRSSKWTGILDGALAATWNGSIPVDDDAVEWTDDGLAKNWTALKTAYKWFLADNPKVIEAAKKAGKAEATERAEAAMVASASGHSTTTSSQGDEGGEERTDEEEMIHRMVNAKRGGRSLSSLFRSKR